ncbi:MAG: hypothetical protein IKW99_03500 [Bacteroidales bacterium]|nr:hypothetical protein [Bacteroidales bacterium]
MNPEAGKIILSEFLAFLKYKVDNDLLTMEEVDSLAKAFADNIRLTGTIDDLAGFYRQSRNNVKVVINRNLIAKPQRRVFYSFNAFRKIVPKRWLESYRQPSDSQAHNSD